MKENRQTGREKSDLRAKSDWKRKVRLESKVRLEEKSQVGATNYPQTALV